MTNQYEFKLFVRMVQDKLSTIHYVDGFKIGKNKITFTVNNYPVEIQKDYLEGRISSRIIITCDEMFPCVINTVIRNKIMFLTLEDVIIATNAIDNYFMEKIGYNHGVCSRYEALKYLLLPFFIYDYRRKKDIAKIQGDILYYLIGYINESAPNEPLFFAFTGEHKKNSKRKRYYIVATFDTYCIIYSLRYNAKEEMYEVINNEALELKYHTSKDGISHVRAVRNFLKNYTNFKVSDFTYTEYVEEDKNYEDEDHD